MVSYSLLLVVKISSSETQTQFQIVKSHAVNFDILFNLYENFATFLDIKDLTKSKIISNNLYVNVNVLL